jgi:hypothetical protein
LPDHRVRGRQIEASVQISAETRAILPPDS